MIKVVVNEQHGLKEEQVDILDNYGEWEKVLVPAKGWTLEEMDEQIDYLVGHRVVFVSPIPYMIAELVRLEKITDSFNVEVIDINPRVLIFHNDNRVKKELDNGRVIQTVAETGWQLV